MPAGLSRKRILAGALIFLAVLSVYLVKFRYAGSGDTIPNEFLPITIIREHNLDFNEFVSNSKKLQYCFAEVDGRIVSYCSVFAGLMNMPVYLAAFLAGADIVASRYMLSMISASLITALSVLFMYLALLRLPVRPGTAVFFSLIYAFGTTAWSITSRGMWHHTTSLLSLTTALAVLLGKNERLLPIAGLFLGLMVLDRQGNAALVLPLFAYIYFNHRKHFPAAAALSLVPMFFLLKNMGVWKHELGDMSGNILAGAAGLLFSPARGLFIFSPFMIFAAAGIYYAVFVRNENKIFSYLAAGVLGHYALFSAYIMWWGGHSFGYRYMTEAVPLLILFAAHYWDKVVAYKAYLRVPFAVCLALSLYFHFLGAFYYPSGFNWHPDDINKNAARLWDFRDTELTRCTAMFLMNSGAVKPGFNDEK